VLVGDTKITDTTGGEPTYRAKLTIPLEKTPFVIGAAGFTDLFSEFNRKIPIVVGERLREYQIKNIAQLVETGMSHDEATAYVMSESIRLSQTQEPPAIEDSKPVEKPKAALPIPYVYTAENFLDDCKGLIRGVVEQAETGYANPLEALAVIYRPQWKTALLHYIDGRGRESTIDFYHPIGSGSPYVKMFFDRLYRWDRPLIELIGLACYAIAFTARVAKEAGVGYTITNPPQTLGVLPEGACGEFRATNMPEVMADLEKQLEGFTAQIAGFKPPVFDLVPSS